MCGQRNHLKCRKHPSAEPRCCPAGPDSPQSNWQASVLAIQVFGQLSSAVGQNWVRISYVLDSWAVTVVLLFQADLCGSEDLILKALSCVWSPGILLWQRRVSDAVTLIAFPAPWVYWGSSQYPVPGRYRGWWIWLSGRYVMFFIPTLVIFKANRPDIS